MGVCAVLTCRNKGVHKFPTDETLKRQWIKATKIDVQRKIGWNLRKYSTVCSNHFTQSDFKSDGKLKSTAVPSIFSWTAKPIVNTTNKTITGDSFSQDFQIAFNPNNAKKNYSKSEPSVIFVEEYPCMIDEPEADTDPLRISDESNDAVPGESGIEFVIDMDEDQNEITTSNENYDEHIFKCDRSAQTECSMHDTSAFSIFKYKDNGQAIHFYTGLETFQKMMFIFNTLGDTNLKYFYETPSITLKALDQFFITLIILRRHKEFEEIAMLYLIPVKQVANIFITWIRFMSLQWQNLDLWIDRESVTLYMPLDFYDKYPMTRVVLDATECPIKKPGLPLPQQATFSSYKNRNTVKFLIGIAPSGLITYISPSYGGSATDRQIIERSSILHKFNFNDEIMVDKGLNVQDIFMPYGVKVNMPSFFKKGNQINPETLIRDRKVASKRVHVERVIGMLKTYRILKQPMNQTETMLSSDIVFICAMLVNFRKNIVNKCS